MTVKTYAKIMGKMAKEENIKNERASKLKTLYALNINPSLIQKKIIKGVN